MSLRLSRKFRDERHADGDAATSRLPGSDTALLYKAQALQAQAFYADKSLRCLNERRRAPRKRAGFS
jgi:hypothetical protein